MSDASLTNLESDEDDLLGHDIDDKAAQDSQSLTPPYQQDNLAHHESLTRKSYILASRFQGHLPPPDLLAGYEKVLPGLANRLVLQMELNGSHRRYMDKATLLLRQGRSYLGLGAGLCVVLLFLNISYKLIIANHEVAGTILGSVDLVALTAVFVGIGQQYKSGKANDKPNLASDTKSIGPTEDATAVVDKDNQSASA